MQREIQHQGQVAIKRFPGHQKSTMAVWKGKCGEQDSNLRTVEDCDLNAAPLTKLGDPRVVETPCWSVIKSPLGLLRSQNGLNQRRECSAVRFW